MTNLQVCAYQGGTQGGSSSSSTEGSMMELVRKHMNLKEQYGNRI